MPKKKKQKKLNKLKNTIIASFQAIIVWNRTRKRENKNYRFVTFLPDALKKILQKYQKNKKIRKYHYGFISSQNRLKVDEKERN